MSFFLLQIFIIY